MSPGVILASILCYFSVLFGIAAITSRNAGNEAYFLGNKKSPWYAVAFGMIGDSLSGVTFISLPGTVESAQFSYMQLVLGYLLGYFLIAKILLPLYYKYNLTSIYGYLNSRFGRNSQVTGSFFFLISRLIGAALRLYLAAAVLQLFVFDYYHVPFFVTVTIIICLMLLYTYRGGIKTLVWTDTLQSGLLLAGVILSIYAILSQLDWSIVTAAKEIAQSEYSTVFFWDPNEKSYFIKQFLSGAFIAVVMTGLDQNMMQKSLSVPNLRDAQKNLYWFSFVLVLVNILFISLGALLYLYSAKQGIHLPLSADGTKTATDQVFPFLALNHLGIFAAIVFCIGLIAATFSSADSVLTTLTTSFCLDVIQTDKKYDEKKQTKIRHWVHIGFSFLLLITILLSEFIPKTSILDLIFTSAAFTYGPLLGLFVFGLFTKRNAMDNFVPAISIVSVLITFILYFYSEDIFNGYKFGYELLLFNGLFTFAGLYFFSRKNNHQLLV
ncbi:MAG: sodium:solute symporter [Crocinitomicaceae bacterium]|nr:sodium:solute symporter [Crocinitomicaceae bacterium]